MAGRWLKGLGGADSASAAARLAAEARLADVVRAARALSEARSDRRRVRAVHFLRVATRRADAALRAFESEWESGSLRAARKALRKIRRAAGDVRDADVQAELIRDLGRDLPRDARRSARVLLDRIEKERAKRSRALNKVVGGRALPRLRRAVEALRPADSGALSPREHARHVIARRARESSELAAADLSRPAALHELRLSLKRLRYGIEVFAELLPPEFRTRVYPVLERMQSRLGRVNDLTVLLERAREVRKAADLAQHLEALLDREHAAALRAVRAAAFRRALDRCISINPTRGTAFQAAEGVKDRADMGSIPLPWQSGGRGLQPVGDEEKRDKQGQEARATTTGLQSARRAVVLAAIDVGSNAVRLRVERWEGGSRQVLADERRTTRLGRGLAGDGRLDAESIRATVELLEEFARRARDLGAGVIAAVATAAVREAPNGSELIALARSRAGLDLRVIDADEEARLGLRAAADALHMEPDRRLGLVDVGGGSVEVAVSIRGVIVFLVSMPLGAVRLTESFGGPVISSTDRFEEMCRAIDSTLDEHLAELRPALRPDAIVGVGGTFTTLGFMARRGRPRPPGAGLERVRASRLDGIIERLRVTPIEARAARFPGLPGDRADIIVAGLAVIRAVMRRLSARSFVVQEGGVREGMILSLAEGRVPGAPMRSRARHADVLAQVHDFARRAACEQPHSAHVAALSLDLFDRLRRVDRFAPLLTRRRDSRLLLECAAHLHDAGCLVEYPAHHRHSQRMILHADLPALTGERRRVVAAVARYHRKSGPPDEPRPGHEPYFALPPDRREQIKALASVLRVADGLDRAHRQVVVGTELVLRGDDLAVLARVAPDADPEAVRLGISAARSKGDLLESVFGVRLTVRAEA